MATGTGRCTSAEADDRTKNKEKDPSQGWGFFFG